MTLDSDPESEFDFNDLDGPSSKLKRRATRGREGSQMRQHANALTSLQAEQITQPTDGCPPMKIVKQVDIEKQQKVINLVKQPSDATLPTKTFKEGTIKTISVKSIKQPANVSQTKKETAYTGIIENPREEMERQEKAHRNSMLE